MIRNLPDRIFLCGFMGTGKTTIGKLLSQKLAIPFLDLDDRIEEEAGKDIPQIFKEDGERAFRKLERTCLLDVIKNYKGVVALGGGALQNQHLIDHIKLNGLLIFIETPFSLILDRIVQERNRPLLLNEQGTLKEKEILEKELKTLYGRRLPFYRQAELIITHKENTSLESMVGSLIKKIRYHVSHY